MAWFRRKRGAEHGEPTQPAKLPKTDKSLESLTAIANEHLPPDLAERWVGLLRPAVRLYTADADAMTVARLGGRPRVPEGFEWPTWEGSGPLCYIGEIDLEALDEQGLDPGITLPKAGRLLAFYFDGSYDNFASIVGTWDRDSLEGARLIHVLTPPDRCVDLKPADGVLEFGEQSLAGRQIMTHPGWEHHLLRREFGGTDLDYQSWRKMPIQADAFNDALFALDEGEGPRHQIGGWADPVQGPVELEVAQAVMETGVEYGDAAQVDEALAWRQLLQIDSDDRSGMCWGDVGTLYWLRRDSDHDTTVDLGPVSFTWQCS